MAMRAAVVSVGRQQNPNSILFLPHYLRTRCSISPPAAQLLHRSHRASCNNNKSTGILSLNSEARRFKYRITRAVNEAIAEPPAAAGEEDVENIWKVKMLYDGECPLCMREVNMLRERNHEYRTIKFVDISSQAYNPEDNQGLEYTTVMGRIHAILSDGTVVTDVEAFRKLYEAVGLGWVYAITKYEPISRMANVVYAFWAKYRLQITGRPSLEDVIKARGNKAAEVCGDNKSSCNIRE
ncbi:uncharacterized protein At5g50100, chloroplastic [Impatiens glandulifera]|uniref:uncharacterized protein At5g50100, chloroplastic n=1 Tax=Impatiens glandulifera TaxID=253017 RepID=UPI001FB14715|nr:uncharacterized protein At5g50100, chloroplastic [Impatiens glandulifera]